MRAWAGWFAGAGGRGVGLRLALRALAFRLRFDAGVLRLPLLGRLARGYNAARFAGTLAMLAAAGVPILKALQSAAETLLQPRDAEPTRWTHWCRCAKGHPLGAALAGKRFPGLIAVRLPGRATGELPDMLGAAPASWAPKCNVGRYTATVLEPLLIAVMGLVVLLIVLAVLMPIIQLNAMVK